MQEISNSLRQRLGARPQPQTHPDADILNAYVEQVLPGAERADVVLHLAECSHCREVISLSLGRLEAAPQLQSVAARSRFWIPAFRLGTAVAALAVAATLIVERPWPARHAVQPKDAQVLQSPAAVVPQSTASNASAPATLSAENSPLQPPEIHSSLGSTGLRTTASPQTHVERSERSVASPPPPVPAANLGTVASVSGQSQVVASPPAPTDTHATLTPQAMATVDHTAPAATELRYRDAGHDYLNRNVFRNEVISGNVESEADAVSAAPASQNSTAQTPAAGTRGAAFPAISTGDIASHAFDVNVAPPNTTSGRTSSTSDTTLKHSMFYSFPRKVEGTVVTGAKKAGSAAGSVVEAFGGRTSFTGNALAASPGSALADKDIRGTEKPEEPTQWRISDGTLMKSTDSTQWHEAFPQGPSLQLKVYLIKGDQVWAGGSNATIIHSWNAGVDWETLKVPDSGDITSIKVDDGWQVKTSDGETFVSQDHGKTWVPLEAQPK